MDETARQSLLKLGDLISQLTDEGVDLGYLVEHVAWSLDTLAGDPQPRGQRCFDDNGNLI